MRQSANQSTCSVYWTGKDSHCLSCNAKLMRKPFNAVLSEVHRGHTPFSSYRKLRFVLPFSTFKIYILVKVGNILKIKAQLNFKYTPK